MDGQDVEADPGCVARGEVRVSRHGIGEVFRGSASSLGNTTSSDRRGPPSPESRFSPSRKRPFPSGKRSFFLGRSPSYSEKDPSFREKDPSFREKDPPFSEKVPSFREKVPCFSENEPSFRGKEPSFSEKVATPLHRGGMGRTAWRFRGFLTLCVAPITGHVSYGK